MPGDRHAGAADAVALRRGAVRIWQPEGRAAHAARARAAADARRHDHAEPAALHHPAFGHSRHRPGQHRFIVHGMVKQPLEYTVDELLRYPLVTRKHFVECGGNSAAMFSNEPLQATVQQFHGLVSCAEWTGVPLSMILDEAGVDQKAVWMMAEGADDLLVSRSVPLKKGYEDAMIAFYQNGERLMPGNGYPMRLLLPGFEGNMNVKFLRRLIIIYQPAMTFYETRNYSPLLPDGKAYRFYFVNEVKSFITKPSFGMSLKGPGYYEISGLAYRAAAPSPRFWSPPTAARAGARLPSKGRRRRRRSRAFACRGAGTASR